MKITVKELLDSTQAIARVASIPLNSALKFRLARVLKQVKDESESFDRIRTELCEKYGMLKEDGSQYDFEPEKKIEFDKEYAALLKESVEIRFDTFSEESFANVDVASIDIMNLSWLFGGLDKEEEADNA